MVKVGLLCNSKTILIKTLSANYQWSLWSRSILNLTLTNSPSFLERVKIQASVWNNCHESINRVKSLAQNHWESNSWKQNILMEAEVGEEQTDMGIYMCNTSANVSSAKQVYKYSKFIVHTFSLLQFVAAIILSTD